MLTFATLARGRRGRSTILIGLPLSLLLFSASSGCFDSDAGPLVDGGGEILGSFATTDGSLETEHAVSPQGIDQLSVIGDRSLTFAAERVFCCSPRTIQFFAELLAEDPRKNITYEWKFGDGRTGRGEAVEHTYASLGDFYVTLTAHLGNDVTIEVSRALSLRTDGDGTDGVVLAPAAVDADGGTLTSGADEDRDSDISVASRLRAVYGPSDGEHLATGGMVDDALADGFTDFVAKFGLLESPLRIYDVRGLDAWIQKLEGTGSAFWAAINWVSSSELAWIGSFEAFVTADGVPLPNTPCPTSAYFWRRSIAERGAALAAIALDHPVLRGMVVDVEMYHSEARKYTGSSYSDTAFRAYFESTAGSGALPAASERYAWVSSHGGEQAYVNFQRDLVRALAANALASIRSVNPAFEVGGTGMLKDGELFYDAFALGFGTAQRPIYEFTQRYYRAGYSGDVRGFLNSYRSRGIHANLVMGLQLDHYPPEALAGHLYTAAIETAGAWIYDATELTDGAQDDNCHTVEEYRSALRFANAEVNTYIADPEYVSSLTAEPFAPACSDEVPVLPAIPYVPLEDGSTTTEALRIRQRTTYYFHVRAGEPISFDLALHRTSSEHITGWWVLKGPAETSIDSGAWAPETSPALVRATANETGLYALVVDPGWRFPFSILNASHPGSYRGSQEDKKLRIFGAHLLERPQLFAYVPPGIPSVSVTVASPVGEKTRVAVFDERDPDIALFEATPAGTLAADFVLALPNETGGDGVVLEIVLENAGSAEDFELKFRDGALPFLSQTRSGLFREP